MFQRLNKQYPNKIAVKVAYDNAIAHKIEAGADMFLMPSRYEPCGLNQIYSLKYGTVPSSARRVVWTIPSNPGTRALARVPASSSPTTPAKRCSRPSNKRYSPIRTHRHGRRSCATAWAAIFPGAHPRANTARSMSAPGRQESARTPALPTRKKKRCTASDVYSVGPAI